MAAFSQNPNPTETKVSIDRDVSRAGQADSFNNVEVKSDVTDRENEQRALARPRNLAPGTTTQPSTDSPTLLSRERSIEVAQLQFPRIPENAPIPFRDQINQGIQATEGFTNDRINDAKKLVGQGQQQLERLGSTLNNSWNDFQRSGTGQIITAPGRAIVNYGKEAVEAVTSGRAQEAVTRYFTQDIPNAIQTVVDTRGYALADVVKYAPQIAQQLGNSAAVNFITHAFDGFPQEIKDHGILVKDNKLGWMVVSEYGNQTVAFDLSGDPDKIGYRLRTSNNSWTPPVFGQVKEDGQLGTIVVETGTNASRALTSQGWVVKEPSGGWSAPYPNGVRAELSEELPSGQVRKVYGIAVVPEGAAKSESIFIRPDGGFQVRTEGRERYSTSYDRDRYAPVVLDGKVWAQDSGSGALINTNSKNEGLVRLPTSNGYTETLKGRYTDNQLTSVEGKVEHYPGVQLYEFKGRPVDPKSGLTYLGGNLFRVEQGGKLGLSGALEGYPTVLNGKWGVEQKTSTGESVVTTPDGVAAKGPGQADYCKPVVGGAVVTLQTADGKQHTGVAYTDQTPVNAKSTVLRNNVVNIGDQVAIRRPDGSFSEPLKGTATVHDGRIVVETELKTNEGRNYRVLSDGQNLQISDGKKNNSFTPPAEGTFIDLKGAGVGIQLKNTPDSAVFALGDGTTGFSLRSPSGSWSKPIAGQLAQKDGQTYVASGDLLFANTDKGMVFYDQRNASAGWQELNPPKQAETRVERAATPIEQVQRTVARNVEKLEQVGQDIATATAYTLTPEGAKDLVLGENGLVQNAAGAIQGTGEGLLEVVTNNGFTAPQSQNQVQNLFRGATNNIGNFAIDVGSVIAIPETGGASLAGNVVRRYHREMAIRQNEIAAQGGNPLDAYTEADTTVRATTAAGATALSAIPVVTPGLTTTQRVVLGTISNGGSSVLMQGGGGATVNQQGEVVPGKVQPGQVAQDLAIGAGFDAIALRAQRTGASNTSPDSPASTQTTQAGGDQTPATRPGTASEQSNNSTRRQSSTHPTPEVTQNSTPRTSSQTNDSSPPKEQRSTTTSGSRENGVNTQGSSQPDSQPAPSQKPTEPQAGGRASANGRTITVVNDNGLVEDSVLVGRRQQTAPDADAILRVDQRISENNGIAGDNGTGLVQPEGEPKKTNSNNSDTPQQSTPQANAPDATPTQKPAAEPTRAAPTESSQQVPREAPKPAEQTAQSNTSQSIPEIDWEKLSHDTRRPSPEEKLQLFRAVSRLKEDGIIADPTGDELRRAWERNPRIEGIGQELRRVQVEGGVDILPNGNRRTAGPKYDVDDAPLLDPEEFEKQVEKYTSDPDYLRSIGIEGIPTRETIEKAYRLNGQKGEGLGGVIRSSIERGEGTFYQVQRDNDPRQSMPQSRWETDDRQYWHTQNEVRKTFERFEAAANEVLQGVNEQRQSQGLAPLSVEELMSTEAGANRVQESLEFKSRQAEALERIVQRDPILDMAQRLENALSHAIEETDKLERSRAQSHGNQTPPTPPSTDTTRTGSASTAGNSVTHPAPQVQTDAPTTAPTNSRPTSTPQNPETIPPRGTILSGPAQQTSAHQNSTQQNTPVSRAENQLTKELQQLEQDVKNTLDQTDRSLKTILKDMYASVDELNRIHKDTNAQARDVQQRLDRVETKINEYQERIKKTEQELERSNDRLDESFEKTKREIEEFKKRMPEGTETKELDKLLDRTESLQRYMEVETGRHRELASDITNVLDDAKTGLNAKRKGIDNVVTSNEELMRTFNSEANALLSAVRGSLKANVDLRRSVNETVRDAVTNGNFADAATELKKVQEASREIDQQAKLAHNVYQGTVDKLREQLKKSGADLTAYEKQIKDVEKLIDEQYKRYNESGTTLRTSLSTAAVTLEQVRMQGREAVSRTNSQQQQPAPESTDRTSPRPTPQQVRETQPRETRRQESSSSDTSVDYDSSPRHSEALSRANEAAKEAEKVMKEASELAYRTVRAARETLEHVTIEAGKTAEELEKLKARADVRSEAVQKQITETEKKIENYRRQLDEAEKNVRQLSTNYQQLEKATTDKVSGALTEVNRALRQSEASEIPELHNKRRELENALKGMTRTREITETAITAHDTLSKSTQNLLDQSKVVLQRYRTGVQEAAQDQAAAYGNYQKAIEDTRGILRDATNVNNEYKQQIERVLVEAQRTKNYQQAAQLLEQLSTGATGIEKEARLAQEIHRKVTKLTTDAINDSDARVSHIERETQKLGQQADEAWKRYTDSNTSLRDSLEKAQKVLQEASKKGDVNPLDLYRAQRGIQDAANRVEQTGQSSGATNQFLSPRAVVGIMAAGTAVVVAHQAIEQVQLREQYDRASQEYVQKNMGVNLDNYAQRAQKLEELKYEKEVLKKALEQASRNEMIDSVMKNGGELLGWTGIFGAAALTGAVALSGGRRREGESNPQNALERELKERVRSYLATELNRALDENPNLNSSQALETVLKRLKEGVRQGGQGQDSNLNDAIDRLANGDRRAIQDLNKIFEKVVNETTPRNSQKAGDEAAERLARMTAAAVAAAGIGFSVSHGMADPLSVATTQRVEFDRALTSKVEEIQKLERTQAESKAAMQEQINQHPAYGRQMQQHGFNTRMQEIDEQVKKLQEDIKKRDVGLDATTLMQEIKDKYEEINRGINNVDRDLLLWTTVATITTYLGTRHALSNPGTGRREDKNTSAPPPQQPAVEGPPLPNRTDTQLPPGTQGAKDPERTAPTQSPPPQQSQSTPPNPTQTVHKTPQELGVRVGTVPDYLTPEMQQQIAEAIAPLEYGKDGQYLVDNLGLKVVRDAQGRPTGVEVTNWNHPGTTKGTCDELSIEAANKILDKLGRDKYEAVFIQGDTFEFKGHTWIAIVQKQDVAQLHQDLKSPFPQIKDYAVIVDPSIHVIGAEQGYFRKVNSFLTEQQMSQLNNSAQELRINPENGISPTRLYLGPPQDWGLPGKEREMLFLSVRGQKGEVVTRVTIADAQGTNHTVVKVPPDSELSRLVEALNQKMANSSTPGQSGPQVQPSSPPQPSRGRPTGGAPAPSTETSAPVQATPPTSTQAAEQIRSQFQELGNATGTRQLALDLLNDPNYRFLAKGQVAQTFLSRQNPDVVVRVGNIGRNEEAALDLASQMGIGPEKYMFKRFPDGGGVVVMERVPGVPLTSSRSKLSPEEKMKVCDQVTDAMAALNSRGMLWNDAHAGNVMVADGPSGVTSKIIDFDSAAPVNLSDQQALYREIGKAYSKVMNVARPAEVPEAEWFNRFKERYLSQVSNPEVKKAAEEVFQRLEAQPQVRVDPFRF